MPFGSAVLFHEKLGARRYVAAVLMLLGIGILSLDGEKTVAIGGDLDGCEALAAGMTGVESVAALYDALARRGYGAALLTDILWNNWRRLL